MKPRSFIVRGIAFLLLLVFLQKTGAGLLFHDLVHAKTASAVPPGTSSTTDISYTCSCIDDFLMPFTATDDPVLIPALSNFVTPVESYTSAIPFQSSVFSPLRGPPTGNL